MDEVVCCDPEPRSLTWDVDGGKQHICQALTFCDLNPGILSEHLNASACGYGLSIVLDPAQGQTTDGCLDALEKPAVRDGQVVGLLLAALPVGLGEIHAAGCAAWRRGAEWCG